MPFASAPRSRRHRTVRPVRVVVLAINWTITGWVSRGLPRQFWVMKANSRCSIRFHLLVPGGRWATVTDSPVASAKPCNFALPQPDPHAVAAAAVGGDQQPGGGGGAGPAEVPPPVPNALDREGGSVVIDAEIDPSGIRGDVGDAVGRHRAQVGAGEVVHPNRFRLALGAQLTAAVLEVSDELFLLRID